MLHLQPRTFYTRDGTGPFTTSVDATGKHTVACPLCTSKISVSHHGNTTKFETHYDSKVCKIGQRKVSSQSTAGPSTTSSRRLHVSSRSLSVLRENLSAVALSQDQELGVPIASSPPLPAIDDNTCEPILPFEPLPFTVTVPLLPLAPLSLGLTAACPGMMISWPIGSSLWEDYPYQQHKQRNLGWRLIGFGPNEQSLRIRSDECEFPSTGSDGKIPCVKCHRISMSQKFRHFVDVATNEAKAHTPHKYLNHQQSVAVIHRLARKCKVLQTDVSNLKRRVRTHQKRLEDYKRIMMLISRNEVAGLRRLLAAAMRRGASPQSMINSLEKAIQLVYRPRGGYSSRELDIAFLVKSLGGPKLLFVLQKSCGLPSLTTLRRNQPIPRLLPSLNVPTLGDCNHNISAFFDPSIAPPPTTTPTENLVGMTLMVDDIAIDSIPRYDGQRDSICGLCREHVHSNGVNLKVESMEMIKDIERRLASEDAATKVCLGSNATVVAVAPLGRHDYYAPVPIIVSPTDKSETGVELAAWLRIVFDSWKTHKLGAALSGPMWAIASDGDASFRLAKHLLCMKTPVGPDTALGALLSPLKGLNLFTSSDQIVGTCDPKHVIKRFATLLRNEKGVMVFMDSVNPSFIIKTLEQLPNISHDSAVRLLDPADKQNVPKAVSLIQTLNTLHTLSPSLSPSETAHRKSLVFFSDVLGHFVDPFINIKLSLSDQVRSLSTYAHLTFVMQRRHGTACLTGALYADTQSIVKSIIFTIARMKLLNPHLRFYIIFEGTDRLELLFSDVRTQDHARNVDILQLSQKLSVGYLIRAALQRNPDLDRGHTRLKLDGAIGIDHVNPNSWEGDVVVGNVDLEKEWKQGQEDANSLLRKYYGDVYVEDFSSHFSKPGFDLLRPRGEYVGVRVTEDDMRSERYETSIPDNPPSHSSPPPSPSDDSEDADDPLGMDIEDFLPDNAGGDPLSFASKERILTFEGSDYLKNSLVTGLNPDRGRKVPMRTMRVRGVAVEDLRQSGLKSLELDDSDSGEGVMRAGDLGAILVRYDRGVCLAVLEMTSFRIQSGGKKVMHFSISEETFNDATQKITVSGQILHIVRAPHFDGIQDYWRWIPGKYIQLVSSAPDTRITQRHLTLEVPAYSVHRLVPSVVHVPQSMDPSAITWMISDQELSDVFDAAWGALDPESGEDLMRNVQLLPSLDKVNDLPYSDPEGKLYLHKNDLPSFTKKKLTPTSPTTCRFCKKQMPLKEHRNHVGNHILLNARELSDPSHALDIGVEPCGFCGADGCVTQMTRRAGKSPRIQSDCDYHYEEMIYSRAAVYSRTTPCTNVPILCALCELDGKPRTVWKYNAVYHLFAEHSTDGTTAPVVPASMMVDMHISAREEDNLGVPEENTGNWREEHGVPDSDAIEALRLDTTKRARSNTAEQTQLATAIAKRSRVHSITEDPDE